MLGVGAGVAWLGTPAGNTFLLRTALDAAAPARGRLDAAGLTTEGLHGLELRGVTLTDADGRTLAAVDRVRVAYDLGGIFGRRLRISEVEVEGGRVDLRGAGPGCVDPTALWDLPPSSGGPWTGIGVDLDIGTVTLRVDHAALCAGAAPLDVDALAVTAAGSVRGPLVTLDAVHATGTVSGPAWAPAPTAFRVSASGRFDGPTAAVGAPAELVFGAQHLSLVASLAGLDGAEPRVDARVLSAHLEPAALGLVGVHGTVELAGTVAGPLAAPEADVAVVLPGGAFTVTGGLDQRGGGARWHADLTAPAPVQLGATLDAVSDARVQGTVSVKGEGLDWPAGVSATATADLQAVVDGVGPYTVRTGSTPITLRQGVVLAPDLRLDGPFGAVTTAVRVDVPAAAGTAEVVDADVDLGALGRYGAPAGLHGRARYAGRVRGSWSAEGAFTLDGLLTASDVGIDEQVQVGAVSGPVHLGWAAGQGQLTSALRLHAVAAPPDGASLAVPDATAAVSLDLGPAGPEGRVDVRAVDVGAAGRPLDLLVANLLLHPGALEFAAVGGALEPARRGPAALDDPALLPDERIAVEGRYDIGGATLALTRARVAPAPGVDWALSAPARVTRVDDRVELEVHAASADGRGALAVSGTLRRSGDCALVLTAQALDLATLHAAGVGPALGGRLDATGRLDGPLRAPRAELDVAVAGLRVPDALDAADLRLALRSDGVSVTLDGDAQATDGARLARLAGHVPLRPRGALAAVDMDAPFSLALTLPPSGSAAWQASLAPAVWPADLPELRLAGQVAFAGTLRRPTATLAGTTRARTSEGWVSFDVDGAVADDQATVRGVAQQQLVRRAEVSGTLGLALSRVTAMLDGAPAPGADVVSALALDLVPLQLPLAAVGAPAALHGSLVGGLHVSGEPQRPRVEGALMVVNGAIGDIPVSPAMLTLTGTDAGYQVDGQLAFGGGGSLRVSGLVPVGVETAASPLDLAVSGDGVPLAAVGALVPGVSGAAGLVKVGGRIGGRPEAPEPDLRLALDGGALSLAPLNVEYSAVKVAARLTASGLTLDELSAVTTSRTAGLGSTRAGSLRVSGRVALDRFRPGAVRGTLTLDDAWVANRTDLALRASSTLQVAGTWPRLAVEGRVDVDASKVVLAESFFTAESSLALDPSIVVVRPGAQGAARAVAAAPPVDLDMDVRVYLNRHADVDITIPMEQFGGELTKSLSNLRFALNLDSPDGLRIRRDHGTLQVVGIVEPLSGVANVLGKNFDIAPGGTVAFTGVDYLSPLLGLDAVLATAGYGNITAHIAGAAQRPQITFSSDQGQSMDDMISVLLFGAPVNELQDQSSPAIAAAVQSIFRSQVNQASALTQLDVLELSAASLTVGKRFGKDVLVEVVYNPNTDTASAPVNPVELRIQVPLWKGWYLEGSGGTGGIGAVSAYSRWRF